MTEEQKSRTGEGNPESSISSVIKTVYAFASALRQDIDPMLDEYTNVKVCRTLTVATAVLLEGIGHHPWDFI